MHLCTRCWPAVVVTTHLSWDLADVSAKQAARVCGFLACGQSGSYRSAMVLLACYSVTAHMDKAAKSVTSASNASVQVRLLEPLCA